jgi:predicted RNA methylase
MTDVTARLRAFWDAGAGTGFLSLLLALLATG